MSDEPNSQNPDGNAAPQEEPRNANGAPEKQAGAETGEQIGSILITIDANHQPSFSTTGKLATDHILMALEHVRVAVYAQIIGSMVGQAALQDMKALQSLVAEQSLSVQPARPGQKLPPGPRRHK